MTAIVIHITAFRENANRAISGCIANRKRIQEVHFIYPGYVDDAQSMWPEWPDRRKRLEDAGVKVYFYARLDPENFKDAQCIIEVPPYCELKLGGFEAVARTRAEADKSHSTFGISTVTKLEGYSPWYGFFIVLCLLDWIWCRLWERNKLFQSTDVRGRFLLRKGERVIIPPAKHFGWRLWNSDVYPKEYAGEGAVLMGEGGGFRHLLWRLHTHAHLNFLGFWWIPILVFWASTTFPWVWAFAWSLSSFWTFSALSLAWLIEIGLALIISSYYIQVPLRELYVLLFPIYFGFFPLVLIYARNYVPQNAWN